MKINDPKQKQKLKRKVRIQEKREKLKNTKSKQKQATKWEAIILKFAFKKIEVGKKLEVLFVLFDLFVCLIQFSVFEFVILGL